MPAATIDTELLSGLRVVIVICGFELGGSERQALLLGRELIARGASVEMWGLFEPHRGPVSDLCEQYGIRWRALELTWDRGPWLDFLTLLHLVRVLRRAGPDVLIPYTMYPNVICGAIWRFTGARLCIWNQRDEGRHRMAPRLERWAVRQVPLFFSNSRHGAEFLAKTLLVEAARIRTAPNGIELQAPAADRSTWRHRLGLGPETFVACMVANLHRFKDHATAVRAWRIVLDRTAPGVSPVLLLAGRRDETTREVEALTEELALGASVRLLGPVADVAGLLQASDLFVFSSRFEGVPNALLEAMAVGLPCVATDLPGVREAMGEEGQCDLVPAGSPTCLADRILEMEASPSTRAAAGERNRRRVALHYDVRQMVAPIVEILRSTMGPHRRS